MKQNFVFFFWQSFQNTLWITNITNIYMYCVYMCDVCVCVVLAVKELNKSMSTYMWETRFYLLDRKL